MNKIEKSFQINSNRLASRLRRAALTRWLWRFVLWSAFLFMIRSVYLGPFYFDSEYVVDRLALSLVVQTMVLYYLFVKYVFPRTIYLQKYFLFFIWLIISHIIIYEANYLTYWYLGKSSEGARLAKDLRLFQTAGLFGFVNDLKAAFYSFLWSFPFAFMILAVRATKDILSFRTKNLQLEKNNLALELSFLKSQVNPHFLFNTLNSVYSRIFATDEQAANLVLQLSELMRYNLYETNETYVALDKELNFLQNYLDLERNRLEGQGVRIDFVESGEATRYQIAPHLLVAFVENAFKHGVKGGNQSAYVQVMAIIEGEQLFFQVENSIPPKREAAPSSAKSGGVGLGSVRRRLDAFYEGQYTLDVTETDETYTVLLTIRLEPKAD